MLRLLEPTDGDLICSFYRRLSAESVYRRFLAPVRPSEMLLRRLLNVDHCRREALIALDAEGIAGVVRFAPSGESTTDVAIVIADAWQRKGLGTMLMKRLAHIARARGIRKFQATMLADNRGAQLFLRHFAPQTTFKFIDGVIEAEVPLGRSA